MSITPIEPDDYSHADGPGKFEGNMSRRAAAYVYDLSLDQSVETCGTIEYGSGHYALIYLDLQEQETCIALGWTRDTDAAPESKPVAAIVAEDDRGFVYTRFYDSEDAAQTDFTMYQAEYDELDAEDDDG